MSTVANNTKKRGILRTLTNIAAAALNNIAPDKVSDSKKQEKLNKGLTQKEVDEIRAKGGSIVYHYRSNKTGDLLQDWYGRMYSRNPATGVITRLVPKVNGKLARKQRRLERLKLAA